jgi:hypothetical protein
MGYCQSFCSYQRFHEDFFALREARFDVVLVGEIADVPDGILLDQSVIDYNEGIGVACRGFLNADVCKRCVPVFFGRSDNFSDAASV